MVAKPKSFQIYFFHLKSQVLKSHIKLKREGQIRMGLTESRYAIRIYCIAQGIIFRNIITYNGK